MTVEVEVNEGGALIEVEIVGTGPAGRDGQDGAPGAPGADGAPGEPGQPGENGADGNGIASAVLNADYTLTLTFTDGTSYTTPPIRGAQGAQGIQGVPGQDGADGQDGAPGADGEDGYSPAVTVTEITGGHRVTITDKTHQSGQSFDVMDGEDGADGADGSDGITPTIGENGNWYLGSTDTGKPSRGAQGQQGAAGQDGDDGVSPTITSTSITGGHRLTITDVDGTRTVDVLDGEDGEDGAQGAAGKSAYEAAQDGGYSGTEAQFNSDLAEVSDKQDTITASGILKGNGSGGVSAAAAGTDYQAPLSFRTNPEGAYDKINDHYLGAKYDDNADEISTTYATKSELNGKLSTTGDGSNVTAAFTQATTRANIATGEKLSVLYGKVAKWFADLKTVAFTGSYNDLSNKPTIPTVPTTLSAFTDDLGSSPVHTHSQYLTQHQSLSAYRTASAQDTIDSGKEAKGKITISGVEKTANTHTVTIVTNGVTSNITLVGVS